MFQHKCYECNECAKDEGEECGTSLGLGTCKHEMWCLKECGEGLYTDAGIPFGPYGKGTFMLRIWIQKKDKGLMVIHD